MFVIRLSVLLLLQCSLNVFAIEQQFPPDFLFGASTAAVQVEGAAHVDGKGESMWDFKVRMNPTTSADNSTPEETANSFSISWTRILPTGLIYKINEKGVQYYNKLIDGLLAAGIQPWMGELCCHRLVF
ncbi:unnamed protein product [Leptidea sinapis]|uniref:Uncharacterized protein n=1 Tax=Leptidea sinapis TaxID=189913 RepID=A0A5E4Q7A8_9NEOP|nr:unnamed protein product [Leptidea sinapis]